MRIHLTNLGCKLNQAELERLARELHAAGHRVVESLDEADLHVVNSCTITHRAARDSRKVARRGHRVRPGLRTVLTGCYATGSPEEAARVAGVDLVVSNEHKDELVERIHRAFPDSRPAGGLDAVGSREEPAPAVPDLAFGNTRAAVKIEDGCNVGCSFCVIPSTRGRQRSRPVAEVVAEVGSLAAAGIREVVLTGVQISHYRRPGSTGQGRGLVELVRELLDRTPVERLRLTSLAPWAFDRRLLDLLRHPRLCRHVHMSLQSGCDRTLERMGRPYAAARFAALVEEIRGAVAGIAVTTDVIVGFPGETEDDFAASRERVRRIGFARTHVFPYSPRAGTAAAELPERPPPEVLKRRTVEMLAVAAEGERLFRAGQVGAVLPVLWETEDGGVVEGTSDNYLRVTAPAAGPPGRLAGRVTPTRVVGLLGAGLRAAAPMVQARPERAARRAAGA